MKTWYKFDGELINLNNFEVIKEPARAEFGSGVEIAMYKDDKSSWADKKLRFDDWDKAKLVWREISAILAGDYVGLHKFVE